MAYATIQRGASKDGYVAVPIDGSSFYITLSQAAQLRVYEGLELSEQEFESLRAKVLTARCRLKAMDYLARREHGRKELEVKLRQKEFPPEVIAEQLDRLEAERLLDDYRFATQFISARQRRSPEGPQVLSMRLVQRGVDRSLADRAVAAWFAEEDASHDAIQRAAEKLLRRCSSDRLRLHAELRKKGFSSLDIQRYFEEQGD